MTVTPPSARALQRGLAALVAAGVLWLSTVASAPLAAADGLLLIGTVRATVTGTGDQARVSVSATVTNTSAAPVYHVAAALWRSPEPLRSITDVYNAIGADTLPAGIGEPVADENTAVIVDGSTGLAAGATREVQLTGNLADLGITTANASSWVGVSVTGSTSVAAAPSTVGTAATLITLPGDTPVPVTTVVDFSAPPHQIKTDLFMDEDLATDITERLTPLLTLAQDHDWVIDPALVAAVEDMADGYRVQTPDGSVKGQHADVAEAWLADFAALSTDRAWSALFAEPDLSEPGVLAAARAATEEVENVDASPIITLDSPTDETLHQVADLNQPVLATNLTAHAPFTRGGVTVIPALQPSHVNLGEAWGPSGSVPAAVDALARANGSQVRLVRTFDDIVASPSPAQSFSDAPLKTALTHPADGGSLDTDQDVIRPLDATTAEQVTTLVDGVSTYAAATPEAGLEALPDAVRARASSFWWAGAADDHAAWLNAVDARAGVATLEDGITLTAATRFSLAGGTSDFPITITNTLVDPVTVTVNVAQDNPQRIRLIAPETATIPAGSSQTITLRAEVHGGGVISSRIHVETLDGRRLTPDKTVTVETTSYGLVGWTLVITSGIVLVVTTALRIRQVRRQQKGKVNG